MSRPLTGKKYITSILLVMIVTLTACGSKHKETEVEIESQTTTTRSNETVVLEPESPGSNVIGTDDFVVDISNAGQGYISVEYSGDNEQVRLQATCDNDVTYTYIIPKRPVFLPLSSGSGNYNFTGYEAIAEGEYAIAFSEDIDIAVENQQGAWLYPNMYVNFDENTDSVPIAKQLAEGCTCDIEVIGKVYEYVTANIVYDHDLAENVQKDYLPDIDAVLKSGKGICFDYASVMASMLRSQRIPTRLEIGYAGTAYHAWISSYIEDVGWINGIIRFDGTDWTLMDPTFAANTSESELKNFIGDGSNYVTKYVY